MYYFDLSIFPIGLIWIGIILLFNIYSIIRTKSIWNAINLGICLLLLIMHLTNKSLLINFSFCVIWDLVNLAVSISLYLYVNDIETRRKVISEVFENRYKKS